MSERLFVNYLYVNAYPLPTYSLIPPDLVRKIFFCTFADVEECFALIPQRSREVATMLSFHSLYIMAKSKSGGTRGMLRGRIANDVYSIGKDGSGKKQQVVRSLAESVANPQTIAQMRGRMIMSTIMQAVSAMSYIIDHSFDTVPAGQPSVSEFIRRNYALIKADIEAHPAAGNTFALNGYQVKGAMPGTYLISQGDVPAVPHFNVTTANGAGFAVSLGAAGATAAQVREFLGLGNYAYITLCTLIHVVAGQSAFNVVRLHPASTLADDTVITKDNFLQLFTVENPASVTINVTADGESGLAIEIMDADMSIPCAAGIIGTRNANGIFKHTTSSLRVASFEFLPEGQSSSDLVLPSYPEGSQRFLNGGEV